MGAQSLYHAKDYRGEFFRRITRKLGKPLAVTATAHKLARIIFHLLSTREPCSEAVYHQCEEETLKERSCGSESRPPNSDFRSPGCNSLSVPWESAGFANRYSADERSHRRLGGPIRGAERQREVPPLKLLHESTSPRDN